MVMTARTHFISKLFFNRQWNITALSLLLICFSITGEAAKIQVGIDRAPVAINESFQLTFSSTETPDGQPDFSPMKQDFNILNQQQSTQSSWINGKSSHSTKWILTVMANKSGTLTIPTIHFGDDASSPIKLTVEAKSQASTTTNDKLFLDVEVSSPNSYVQQQIIYTVRFYQRIQLAQAALSEPKVEHAVVESLSENSYKTQIKGQQYLVTERSYAIFPQRSGTLEIPPLTLTAQIAVNNVRSSRFDSFFDLQNTKTERILSKSIKVEVKPIPEDLKGVQWLAVKDLTLQETWSNKDIKINVGEPLTRTITLAASGAITSQLPNIPLTSPALGLKVYPDQVSDDEQKSPNGIRAIREQKIAFIPSKAGQYKLPAIEVPWLNTQTQQIEIARLPAVTLTAVARAGNTASQTTTATGMPDDSPIVPKPVSDEENTVGIQQKTSYLWQILAVLFAFLWLITLFYLFKIHSQNPVVNTSNTERSKEKTNHTLKALKEACLKNDPQACQRTFIKWAEQHYKTTNFSELRTLCSPELQEEIGQLQRHLYSNKKENNWQGERFLHAFLENNEEQATSKKNDADLEPLHRI